MTNEALHTQALEAIRAYRADGSIAPAATLRGLMGIGAEVEAMMESCATEIAAGAPPDSSTADSH